MTKQINRVHEVSEEEFDAVLQCKDPALEFRISHDSHGELTSMGRADENWAAHLSVCSGCRQFCRDTFKEFMNQFEPN